MTFNDNYISDQHIVKLKRTLKINKVCPPLPKLKKKKKKRYMYVILLICSACDNIQSSLMCRILPIRVPSLQATSVFYFSLGMNSKAKIDFTSLNSNHGLRWKILQMPSLNMDKIMT